MSMNFNYKNDDILFGENKKKKKTKKIVNNNNRVSLCYAKTSCIYI